MGHACDRNRSARQGLFAAGLMLALAGCSDAEKNDSGGAPNGFLTDCKATGANWGSPQQAGPCASGVTLYGVKIQFGRYGAASEYNVGQGFENAVSGADTAAGCSGFIDAFGADPVGSADLKDTHDLDLALYTVFYPGSMPEGETFPVITWSNGTCAMPEGYGTLLRYIASYGYIVVAPNSRYTLNGSPLPGVRAIDFMFAENEKPGSKFFHKVDTSKVGATGHSQGAGAASRVSLDPRVGAAVLFNQGTASKPFLDISGVRDLGGNGAVMASAVDGSGAPGAYLFYHQIPQAVNGSSTGALAPGHLTLMMEPERVMEPARAWFDMTLKGDGNAKQMFLGDSCALCDGTAYPSRWSPFLENETTSSPSFEYGHNSLLQ
jgi:hypothetical protein